MPSIRSPYLDLARVIGEQITSVDIHTRGSLSDPPEKRLMAMLRDAPSQMDEPPPSEKRGSNVPRVDFTDSYGGYGGYRPSNPVDDPYGASQQGGSQQSDPNYVYGQQTQGQQSSDNQGQQQQQYAYEPPESVLRSQGRRKKLSPSPTKEKKLKAKKADVEVIHPFDEKSFADFILTIRKHLEKQREERYRQASIAFTITLLAIIIGMVMAFAGVVCIFHFGVSIGAIPALSSVISNATCLAAFRFNKEANARLDIIVQELCILDRASMSMHIISKISDRAAKDFAIIELTKNLQGTFR